MIIVILLIYKKRILTDASCSRSNVIVITRGIAIDIIIRNIKVAVFLIIAYSIFIIERADIINDPYIFALAEVN